MSLILLLERMLTAFTRRCRKYVFRKRISCSHRDFTLVGDVTLINTNIQLGYEVGIYPGVMFWGDGSISIGDHVDIGKDTIIYSSLSGAGVSIGSDTAIAAQCYLIDMDHGIHAHTPIRRQDNTVKEISIGNDCWLGAYTTILKGSIIHDGSIIGAKSLVKGTIPTNSIAAGIPARIIKTRN